MASHISLRTSRDLFILAALLATLTITTAVRGDEIAIHRADFQDCDDLDPYPALDYIHPSVPTDRNNVHFYYIADVQHCPSSSRVSVRHTVRNLHLDKPLKFNWDEPRVWHRGLKPDKSWGTPIFLPSYEDGPFVSEIKYGVSLGYAVAATVYPLPRPSERADTSAIKVGDMLVSQFETEYIDAAGTSHHVSVELSSHYSEANLITYSFTREPADVVLALGGLTETTAGQLIATSVSADVGPLEGLVDGDNLNQLPTIFAKEQFLIVPAYSKDFERIDVEATPTRAAIVSVAMLSEDFEPIATNVATLFVP